MQNKIEISTGDFTQVQIQRDGPTTMVSTASGELLAKLLGRRWSLLSSNLDNDRTTMVFERRVK